MQTRRWTIFGRSQSYSAVLSNGAKDINTSYVLNERRVRFNMGDITIDFAYPGYVVAENATNVDGTAPVKSGYSGKVLTNSVNTVYGGKSEGLSETGYLYKAVTRVVKFLDETAKITTNPTTTTAEVVVVITEDGVEIYKGGGATAIQGAKVVTVAGNSAIYNLAGQKVNASYKGIVIKDGKKYIQK